MNPTLRENQITRSTLKAHGLQSCYRYNDPRSYGRRIVYKSFQGTPQQCLQAIQSLNRQGITGYRVYTGVESRHAIPLVGIQLHVYDDNTGTIL